MRRVWRPKQRVYLDYNATAPVRPEVQAAVEPLLFGDPAEGGFGNASSVHWAGQAARKRLEQARARLAARLGREPSEIIFTSGGSEADNLALFGHLLHPAQAPKRLVVSAVEHPAVLSAADGLREAGVEVAILGVQPDGQIDLEALERALKVPTGLVAVMSTNNETGVEHDVDAVIARAHAAGARVLVDAVQSVGKRPWPADADLVVFSGHKLGGLKGAGCLVRRDDVLLKPGLVGGPQERGLRAGTEDVAAIVALVEAALLADERREPETARLLGLRRRLEAALDQIPGATIVGRDAPRAPNTVTAVFSGLDGDALLQALDLEGIAASSGSACSSGSLEPSHVLTEMGYPPDAALSAVRFSTGWASTDDDVDAVVEVLPPLLERARLASRVA